MPYNPSSSGRAPPPASCPSTEPAPPPSYEADEEMHGLETFRANWMNEIQQRRNENAEVPEDANDDGTRQELEDDVATTSTPREGRDTRRSTKGKGKKVDRSA
ncbi:hypothetical protein M407DRAFT_24536 [Tulasnella calospora MUT 4182]|uniref:Uncharacterized protein n=1 Tax=Tulasnella calospora MUT 4182 TaxID=1051891 RepID=A0A0C3LXK8_9AGAM|nr:hypothetical protein M407DRAFT_24536 [Tulasnella calospora MUT 4182]